MAAGEYAGFVVRRAREEAGMTGAALARRCAISPSYLSQIEHNARVLTPAVRARIARELGVEAQQLTVDPKARTAAALVDSFAEHAELAALSLAEVHLVADQLPGVASALLKLANGRHADRERIEALEVRLGGDRGEDIGPQMPFEAVRDFIAMHRNYFDTLDRGAEELADALSLRPRSRYEQLRNYLRSLKVEVVEGSRTAVGGQRRYDPQARMVHVATELRPAQKAFQLAGQIALLTMNEQISAYLRTSPYTDDVTTRLTRIGLANYFAGALLLPYGEVLAAARRVRYDLEILSAEFDVGFETVCHRLNTLQRPDNSGIPFALVRVDRAGNISKRQSATPFHFSRTGGTCPLWTVYDAFTRPGQVLRQIAEMPDGRAHLWVARTVTSGAVGFRAPEKTFAVGLGCDLSYAPQTVYAAGLDLEDRTLRAKIGMGCRVCERPACPQRAVPFAGRTLQVDENRGQLYPYMHEPDEE
ncbi:helix-turn-helix domain-containing protein [Flexivirga caeni]|uniref:Helix-turn-helix domain-containing protein n=1 Tax=Flexivirga caeni TaxID=2294115 RepID=A0A3M9ME22_9MICO|nr:short-chain fatty acyl-CoA regulator family protein [Flexivirga caeni]RNI23822.1 helix-turn-helix domain-containing protein [Flexivirga caeni]